MDIETKWTCSLLIEMTDEERNLLLKGGLRLLLKDGPGNELSLYTEVLEESLQKMSEGLEPPLDLDIQDKILEVSLLDALSPKTAEDLG